MGFLPTAKDLNDFSFVYDVNTNQIYTDVSIKDLYTFFKITRRKKQEFFKERITEGHSDFIHVEVVDGEIGLSTNLNIKDIQLICQGYSLLSHIQLELFVHPLKEYYSVL